MTPGYFALLGLTVQGRDFAPGDDHVGADPVGIISDRFWAEALQRRSDAMGLVISVRPVPFRVIGVAPPGFEGARRGERADLWIPSSLVRRMAPSAASSGPLSLMVFGRLGARQSVDVIDERLREMMDPRERDWALKYVPGWAARPLVVPVSKAFGAPDARTIVVSEQGAVQIVAGLALMVLLGGCTTIAALVLVHYERRRGEFALRIALGASRRRLVIELVRDLAVLTGVGTFGGLLFALGGVQLLPTLSLPGGVDLARVNLSIDWQVCAVGVLMTAVTLVIATAMPLARSTRPRLVGEWCGAASPSTSSQRIRQALLATQVCATIIVLVAAGLFVRAVNHGFNAAPGFDIDRTVFATLHSGPLGSSAAESVSDVRAQMAARTTGFMDSLRALPNVENVSQGKAPIGPDALAPWALTVKIGERELQLFFGQLQGSSDLLSTLAVPMLAGRSLTQTDEGQSPVPTVITKSLADRLWPDGSPLGQTFVLPQGRRGPQIVVGVSGDLVFGSLSSPVTGVMTTVSTMGDGASSQFILRTQRPDEVAGAIRRDMRDQVVRVSTGREAVAVDLGRQRLGAWFFSGFGLVALVIGLGGAFGFVAYLAESRRGELAVRMALGASSGQLVGHGVFAALAPVAAGVAAGLLRWPPVCLRCSRRSLSALAR